MAAQQASRPGPSEDTIRRFEQAIGRIATAISVHMDAETPFVRQLTAEQRSWVNMVVQAGLRSFGDWLRATDDVLRLTGDVFAAAPQAMARSVSLQHTVALVELALSVFEEHIPALVEDESERQRLTEEYLRFSRELAFSSARVYARAAESRGAWDDRLEALVIDALVRGEPVDDEPLSQFAALGWRTTGPVSAIAGVAPAQPRYQTIGECHRVLRRLGLDGVVGMVGPHLVIVLGGMKDLAATTEHLLELFGDGPVVTGPVAPDVTGAASVTRAALSGLRAAGAWPGAPRPVSAEALLPERALAGDADARHELQQTVYLPLVESGDVLLETTTRFLEAGGALEATSRALYVHANTVRYRLRRVSDVTGQSPLNARGAFTLRVALALGRMEQPDA